MMITVFRAFILVPSMRFVFSTSAQSYQQRYDSCSQKMLNIDPSDTSYDMLVYGRDTCLVGSVAPDFEALSLEGNKVQFSKFKGRVVVLHFWSTTCVPCIEEMPHLNELVNRYAKQEVDFLSFAPENAGKLKSFLKTNPFHFTIIPDDQHLRADIFKLASFVPYTIVIGKNGRITSMWFGNVGDATLATYKEAIELASKQR